MRHGCLAAAGFAVAVLLMAVLLMAVLVLAVRMTVRQAVSSWGMTGAGVTVGRLLASQFAIDSLGTGSECLLGLQLQQCGIAGHGDRVELELDAAAGAQAAVVGHADFHVEADAEFQGHGFLLGDGGRIEFVTAVYE